MLKHLFKIILIITLGFFLLPNITLAQTPSPVYITIFWGDGCPHCEKEMQFLDKITSEFPGIQVRKLEVWSSQVNAKIMQQTGEKLGAKVSGVPFTVIGSDYISGYYNDEITGARIKNLIEGYASSGSVDFVGQIINQNNGGNSSSNANSNLPEKIGVPFFGEVDIRTWSLPIITVVIAAIDGFNPCAMWVLLFLISLLLGMENKKKMWTLGAAFIVASAVMYFFFLAAWLNLFLFLGFIASIRIIIGLVAIGSGGYHLKEWWFNRNATCRAASETKRNKIMASIRKATEQKVFWLALAGVIAVAFAVNLVELVCSAGLPAIFTNILSSAKLSAPVYYLYLLLYIFIFMLDDLLVFIIAMVTLQATGISTKYTHWANLFGGIIILVLGLLLIFKPGLVMFG